MSAKKPKLRTIGRWYIGETLGKGGYSWVKKGYDKKTGKPVALKFMTKADQSWADDQTKQVITEIESLKQIRHQNVMKLYAYNLNAKYPTKTKDKLDVILLVLEYAPGGELFDILYYTSALEEDIGRTYFKQTIIGLEACHNAGVAHRDIKPQNLLLDSHFNLKITDFGLSKVFEGDGETTMKTSYVGTKGYQAPELLLNHPYDLSCDIFSCGVVLFILLTGYPPFEQATKKDRWFSPLIYGDFKRFWKGHRGCSIQKNEQVKDIINRMLEYDPKKRATIEELKAHPWLQGTILEGKELIKALRVRHRKMEMKRRNDTRKVQDLRNSVTKTRPLPGLNDEVQPPLFPEDHVEQLRDLYLSGDYQEATNIIQDVICEYGGRVEFDPENFKLTSTLKLRKQDSTMSLIRFETRLWKRNTEDDLYIVRFTRLEGDPFDYIQVRDMIDGKCSFLFTDIPVEV